MFKARELKGTMKVLGSIDATAKRFYNEDGDFDFAVFDDDGGIDFLIEYQGIQHY